MKLLPLIWHFRSNSRVCNEISMHSPGYFRWEAYCPIQGQVTALRYQYRLAIIYFWILLMISFNLIYDSLCHLRWYRSAIFSHLAHGLCRSQGLIHSTRTSHPFNFEIAVSDLRISVEKFERRNKLITMRKPHVKSPN